jgi:hypothetical protein
MVLAYRIFGRMEGLMMTSGLGQAENNIDMEWQNVEVKMRGTQLKHQQPHVYTVKGLAKYTFL